MRRLTQRLRTHDWLSLAMEVAIVVVGVFVGIEVSNWNQARQQHAAARDYVARIRQDLDVNIRDIEGRASYYREVREHALAALAAFGQPRDARGARFLRDAYEATQIIPRRIGRTTYDEILSVGAIAWIAEVDVRRRLANYYLYAESVAGVMDFVPPYREVLRRRMPYAVQAAITDQCPEVVVMGGDGSGVAHLARDCVPVLPPALVVDAVSAIDDAELERDLNRLLADIDVKLRVYARVIERARALDAELARSGY